MRDQVDNNQVVIPLHAEDISVAKERIVTGRVKVATVCRERDELVSELLTHERVEVERTPVGKTVQRPPAIRQEGDTLVIPLMEEVIVVERRLVLKEEVRVRRVREAERHQERVNVRRQDVVVTREPIRTQEAAEDWRPESKRKHPRRRNNGLRKNSRRI